MLGCTASVRITTRSVLVVERGGRGRALMPGCWIGQGGLCRILQGFVVVPRLHQPGGTNERGSRQSRTRSEHRGPARRDHLQLWRTRRCRQTSCRGNTTADDPRPHQLQHPLLNVLEDSPHKWLKDMLFVFNAGDIGQYEVLSQRLPEEVRPIPPTFPASLCSPPPFAQPILDNDQDFLRQKICLMALIEAVFKRPRSQRNMSFQTIASETKLPMHEVEHLVMKALRYVHVSPRILMATRLIRAARR